MKGQYLLRGTLFASVAVLCLFGGCGGEKEIVLTPEGTFSVSYLEGKEIGGQYTAGQIKDYELVWAAYDQGADTRGQFLDGFAAAVAATGQGAQAAERRAVVDEAVSGNHFETARNLGTRHAGGLITNEQVQGVIHSSLGVSRGVSLGWKAGYIRGFGAQCVADEAAAGSVNEDKIAACHKEAAATYDALRAAIGR